MSFLHKLTIARLRGAIQPFSLPFEKGKKLTVIYGGNGTGKSTICDALELLGRGEVHSLEGRGLGQTRRYWPAMGKAVTDIAVTLETSDGACHATVSRNGDVIVTPTEARPTVEVFRRSQILSLIEATPAGRYAAIGRFIDVSGIEASEAALRDLIRDLKKKQEVAAAGIAANEAVVRQHWETAGKMGDPIEWADAESKQDLGVFEAEAAALHALQMAYARLAGIPDGLRNAQSAVKAAESASGEAAVALETALRNAPNDAAEALSVLRAVQAYLVKVPAPDACPVCESRETITNLADRIENRLGALSAIREVHSRVDAAKQNAQKAAQQLEDARNRAREEVSRFQETLQAYPWPSGIPLPPQPVPATLTGLETWLKNSMEIASQWKAAEVQRHERKQFIRTLTQALDTLKQNRRAQADMAILLPRLERTLDVMMEERRRFTDDVLAQISNEAGRLYEAIHPGEGLNKISMELDAKKRASLELSASFGGQTAAPQAYFSDSHLDTLGLCVFLALAALDAPEEKILVLDDVLASVDEPHLERVMAMLHAESRGFRHCILTTHYRPRAGEYAFIELAPWSLQKGMCLAAPLQGRL